VGIYGFTAYSASKFALQGFAQALGQELHTRGIIVSLVFPPDTDTPMLANENLLKPKVVKKNIKLGDGECPSVCVCVCMCACARGTAITCRASPGIAIVPWTAL